LQFFDEETAAVLRTLPSEGPLFPYLRTVRAGDRATEFKQRCTGLKIKGVSLHSYRYAWAQRARLAGMPKRFAQEALGQNSGAMHQAYADVPEVRVPSLSDYEKRRAMFAQLPFAGNAPLAKHRKTLAGWAGEAKRAFFQVFRNPLSLSDPPDDSKVSVYPNIF
jgi:integrase